MSFQIAPRFIYAITLFHNNSLWTIPHEIICYVIMSGLIVTGFLRKSFVLPILAGIILAIGLLLPITGAGIDSESVGLPRCRINGRRPFIEAI